MAMMTMDLSIIGGIRDMLIKTIIVALALSLAPGAAALAQDLTGNWHLILELESGPFVRSGYDGSPLWGERIDLVQAGAKITGDYHGNYGELTVTGTSSGGEFTFQYQYVAGRCGIACVNQKMGKSGGKIMGTVILTGAMDGATMVGKVSVSDGANGTFVGRRSTAVSPSEIFDELPAEIQDGLSQEREKVLAGCRSSKSQYSRFFNCGCTTEKHMNSKMLNGPAPSSARKSIDIDSKSGNRYIDTVECINDAGIVEFYRPMCLDIFGAMAMVKDTEGYCTCYSNEMAKNFRKSPNFSSLNLRNLTNKASQACPVLDFGMN